MEFNLFRKKVREDKDNINPVSKTYHMVTKEELSDYAISNNADLKVILFTHTDIAGKVCGVLGKRCFKNIEVKYCSNIDVDDIINTFILIEQKYTEYDLIIVTDVSINKGTVANLNRVQESTNGKTKVLYYNHQECNLEYTKHPWAIIETECDGVKQDSASIFYRNLINNYSLEEDVWLSNLVEKSRRYTKWEWKDLDDTEPNSLSMLCHDTGHEFFVKKLIKKHIVNSDLLDEEDMDKLNYLEDKYQSYKTNKINEVILWKVDNFRTAFVLAEQYIDRLGFDIALHYKNLDSVIIINSLTKLNIRAANNKLVDVTDIAKVFGGNGEKKASGASVPVEIREEMIRHFVSISQDRFNNNKK